MAKGMKKRKKRKKVEEPVVEEQMPETVEEPVAEPIPEPMEDPEPAEEEFLPAPGEPLPDDVAVEAEIADDQPDFSGIEIGKSGEDFIEVKEEDEFAEPIPFSAPIEPPKEMQEVPDIQRVELEDCEGEALWESVRQLKLDGWVCPICKNKQECTEDGTPLANGCIGCTEAKIGETYIFGGLIAEAAGYAEEVMPGIEAIPVKKKKENLEGRELYFTMHGQGWRVKVIKDESDGNSFRYTLKAKSTMRVNGAKYQTGAEFDVARPRKGGTWRLRIGGGLGQIVG